MNSNISRDLKIRLPSEFDALIQVIKISANKSGCKSLAIVGGVIRDAILQNINRSTLDYYHDLDIVLEGSVLKVAKDIENELGPERVTILRYNKDYETIEMKVDNIKVDMATARAEIYSQPGENPNITKSSLKEDLKRRDFSINAIAFDLIEQNLIDIHGGRLSLFKRQLEFLHSHSVSEDPTRVIRASRYAARLNFNLSSKSAFQVKSTIQDWPWKWTKGSADIPPPALATRLRMELELLFKEESWEKAIDYLRIWEALPLLDQVLQNDDRMHRRIHWALKLKVNPLTAMISGASNPISLASRLQLPMKQQEILAESAKLKESINNILYSEKHYSRKPSFWCEVIEKNQPHKEAVALNICLGIPLWKPLLKWLIRWRHIKSSITAKELIHQGWEPGPSLGEELKRQRNEALDQHK